MSKITRFLASNGHTGQVKHNEKLTEGQIIQLIKECYQQLVSKNITLV